MDINGCHVVPEPSQTTEEGFLTTVHCDGVIRGPFKTIREAITAAHAWSQELFGKLHETLTLAENVSPVVVKTISESVAVQIKQPAENPPVIEQNSSMTDASNLQRQQNEVSRGSQSDSIVGEEKVESRQTQ